MTSPVPGFVSVTDATKNPYVAQKCGPDWAKGDSSGAPCRLRGEGGSLVFDYDPIHAYSESSSALQLIGSSKVSISCHLTSCISLLRASAAPSIWSPAFGRSSVVRQNAIFLKGPRAARTVERCRLRIRRRGRPLTCPARLLPDNDLAV